MYPPRFITQCNRHKPSTLDVEYTLQVVKKRKVVCEYQLNIYVKAKGDVESSKHLVMHINFNKHMKSRERKVEK